MENAPFDVAVVGNVGIDTNVFLPGGDIDFSVEGNFTENIDYVGQAGGYTARGYAQLGRRTAFVGYVGDDFCGQAVRAAFAADGIATDALFIDPAGTSRSVNFMYADGRRKNFYDGKSHMILKPDLDACASVLERATFAHFHLPNWARHLLPAAKAAGVTIACDLQDVVSVDDPYRRDFIRFADVLFFSATNHANPEPLIRQFWANNPKKVVVCGMGSQGCALGTEGEIRYFPPVDLPLPIIDTNGAGDGLAVGFLSAYLLEGFSAEEAIRRGQIVARYTCSQRASTSALISARQLAGYFSA